MQIEYLADHPETIPMLAQWHHEQWKHLNPGDSVEQRIAWFQNHLGKGQVPTTFVALSSLGRHLAESRPCAPQAGMDSVLGSASLIAHDMDTRLDLSPWLAGVFVAPQHRGRGIGTALVRRVIQEAETLGVVSLYLFTTVDKRGFYERLGWVLIEHTDYRGYPQIVMARPVTEA